MLMGILRLVPPAAAAPAFFLPNFLRAFSRTLVGKRPCWRIRAIASSWDSASISFLTSWPDLFMASNVNVGMGRVSVKRLNELGNYTGCPGGREREMGEFSMRVRMEAWEKTSGECRLRRRMQRTRPPRSGMPRKSLENLRIAPEGALYRGYYEGDSGRSGWAASR